MAERLTDPSRFLRMFNRLARIGATPAGGVHRLAASREDAAARDWLMDCFVLMSDSDAGRSGW